MRPPFFLKTLLWLNNTDQKTGRQGSVTLISAFMLILFSALGLSMLYFSQIHIKLIGYKKNSMILEYASENGIKKGLDTLSNMISESSSPKIILKKEVEEFLEDAKNKGSKLINKIFLCELPIVLTESREDLKWDTNIRFPLTALQEQDTYFSTSYRTAIISEGILINFNQNKKSFLQGKLEIVTGNLPLSFLPFLVENIPPDMEKEDFLAKNNIAISPSSRSSWSPDMVSFGKGFIPEKVDRLRNKALKINTFYPQKLTNAQIRNILGLEISDDPVPEGVYLIQDDLGLGGIYVQGDIIELVLAIKEDTQVISFQMETGLWVLRYDPALSKTWFSTPTESHFYELTPLGIIIVEGQIQAMGGGIIDLSGEAVLVKDKEIPCILNSVNLTMISSRKVTLSSHLLREGVKWKEGIPYAENTSSSQLNIFSSSGINLHKDSPQEIKIQASLTAAKNGFSINGEDKHVYLQGSLQTSQFNSRGNSLKLFPNSSYSPLEESLQNTPVTANPVILLHSFKILEWADYEN